MIDSCGSQIVCLVEANNSQPIFLCAYLLLWSSIQLLVLTILWPLVQPPTATQSTELHPEQVNTTGEEAAAVCPLMVLSYKNWQKYQEVYTAWWSASIDTKVFTIFNVEVLFFSEFMRTRLYHLCSSEHWPSSVKLSGDCIWRAIFKSCWEDVNWGLNPNQPGHYRIPKLIFWSHCDFGFMFVFDLLLKSKSFSQVSGCFTFQKLSTRQHI